MDLILASVFLALVMFEMNVLSDLVIVYCYLTLLMIFLHLILS